MSGILYDSYKIPDIKLQNLEGLCTKRPPKLYLIKGLGCFLGPIVTFITIPPLSHELLIGACP